VRRLAFLITPVVLGLVPSTAAAQGVDQTCQFSLTRLDATTANVLAVDTNAVYWVGGYSAQPETRIRIEGQFPHSRYMGWNVYDAAGRPIDALADPSCAPRTEARTRSCRGRTGRPSREYTAFIEFRPKPRKPKPNTLYTGDSRRGTFWYRVYISDRGRDAKGGVPLPRVTLERRDGSTCPSRPRRARSFRPRTSRPSTT
jgi:hypothetical protein